jgi:antitoxin MazE
MYTHEIFMETQLSKWGNSLAVRIPKTAADQAALREGDRLELSVAKDGAVTLRPVRGKLALAALLAEITPENRPTEADFGAPTGGEAW